MAGSLAVAGEQPSRKEMRLIIGASSLGTLFEWYDFFIYGTLAPIIGRVFFPTGNPTVELLLSLAGFAVGFGFRPLGAALFGYLGDRLRSEERREGKECVSTGCSGWWPDH